MAFPDIKLRSKLDLLAPDDPRQEPGKAPRLYPIHLMKVGDYFDVSEGSVANVRNAIWRFTNIPTNEEKRFAVRRHPGIDADMRRCVRLA